MAAARRRSTQGSGGSKAGAGGHAKPAKKPSKGKLSAGRRKVATYHRLQPHQKQKLKQQQHQLMLADAAAEPAGPSPFFYAPAAKKTSMHKLLGGNGKPHTMYVLEKSRAPAYYQRLLP
ncbi:hypothetical protein ONE63_007963 [Megalurothrips usitatus]|uniref:Uncharacterized protein n=1 Tax=Megalurothrips usitatus TaxID=439358 RepID=A0AAV7XQ92_9NEOP|nr:hypothetical protein ONE63_007963 [Megalurothrips usitatus]